MNIVLDTNCLIMSLSPKSLYRPVWDAFIKGEYVLCISNDILEEYEEVITRNIGYNIAQIVVSILTEVSNVKYVDPRFHFWMVKNDADDNKFTDCAIAANAEYLVTEDHHFKSALTEDFPKVSIININQFLNYLLDAAIH